MDPSLGLWSPSPICKYSVCLVEAWWWHQQSYFQVLRPEILLQTEVLLQFCYKLSLQLLFGTSGRSSWDSVPAQVNDHRHWHWIPAPGTVPTARPHSVLEHSEHLVSTWSTSATSVAQVGGWAAAAGQLCYWFLWSPGPPARPAIVWSSRYSSKCLPTPLGITTHSLRTTAIDSQMENHSPSLLCLIRNWKASPTCPVSASGKRKKAWSLQIKYLMCCWPNTDPNAQALRSCTYTLIAEQDATIQQGVSLMYLLPLVGP